MTLEEYLQTMIPIIELAYKEKKRNPKTHKSTKLWFLYRHYFYGFEEFINRDQLMYVSDSAKKEYESITKRNNLISQEWKDQPNWDKGRKIFNYDHIFTGNMFRNLVEELWINNNLNSNTLIKLVKENYRIAWILKSEERRIPKSKRGKNIKDAIEIYRANNIILARL